MNYVKKIQFDESYKVKDESYKATADDVHKDVDNYFKLAENGDEDKILFSMTGKNGTGKTSFIKNFLIPDLKDKYDVKYFSILNILETYEPNQPGLRDRLYQVIFQFSKWKSLKLLSTKIDVLSVVFTFILTLLWTAYFTCATQGRPNSLGIDAFHNAGYIVFFVINIILSIFYIALLVFNFMFTKQKMSTKIGYKTKKSSKEKKKVIFIDDLSRIPEELEKEVMIKLASMRDFSRNEVDSIFFLINSDGLIIENDNDDDFVNKFVYQIYDMVFEKDLIISVFTNKVEKPTEEDLSFLASVKNLRDLNAYIRRLNGKINTKNKAMVKTTDKEIKHHLLKRLEQTQAAKQKAEEQLFNVTKKEHEKKIKKESKKKIDSKTK